MISAPVEQRIQAVSTSLLIAGVMKEAADTYYDNLMKIMELLKLEQAQLQGAQQKGLKGKRPKSKTPLVVTAIETKPAADVKPAASPTVVVQPTPSDVKQ